MNEQFFEQVVIAIRDIEIRVEAEVMISEGTNHEKNVEDASHRLAQMIQDFRVKEDLPHLCESLFNDPILWRFSTNLFNLIAKNC